jgi:hypothetical protein
MRLFRRLVILSHRYLGIALSLLVVMWFASGIVMMYAGGMPRVAPQLRLERQPELDVPKVRLTPAEAAARAGVESAPARLVMVDDRPAYRFAGRWPATVFADTGEILEELSLAESRRLASRFAQVPEAQVQHAGTLDDIDQWTLLQSRQLPLHKFRVDDEAGTEVYVSPGSGEVVMATDARSRALAWAGTIPHFLYFTALRTNQPLWYRVVVWTSMAACVLTLLGLILGVTQLRRPPPPTLRRTSRRPFRLSAAIPYAGWMRWHYLTGAVFGVFTLTWAFSGLMSMEPWEWTNATGLEVRRDAFTGGPVDLAAFGAMDPAAWSRIVEGRAIKEIEYLRIQDRHYYSVHHTPADAMVSTRRERLHQPYYIYGREAPARVLVAADTLEPRREPFTVESLMTRLQQAHPDVPVVDRELLSEYDSYYYSRQREAPLPVLRVRFADPAQTWVYIDPATNQVLAEIHRLARVERWLFNGLHSLDFAFLLNSRPLWDVVMITLLLGGLSSSGIGLLLGVRRLRRGAARKVREIASPPRGHAPAGSGARFASRGTRPTRT